jgi:iron-sulfur cluster assembly protein
MTAIMEMTSAAVAPAATPSTTEQTPVLTLTEAAVAQVKEVIASQQLEGHFLTIRVVPAGCSGLGYDLNLLKDKKDSDLTWTQDGIQLVTDKMSAQYLTGTRLDWVKTDTAAGFRFDNPNAKSTCGCGSSFSA